MTDKMKKRIPAVVAGVLLLFWYSVIFSFSAQDGEASGDSAMQSAGFWRKASTSLRDGT